MGENIERWQLRKWHVFWVFVVVRGYCATHWQHPFPAFLSFNTKCGNDDDNKCALGYDDDDHRSEFWDFTRTKILKTMLNEQKKSVRRRNTHTMLLKSWKWHSQNIHTQLNVHIAMQPYRQIFLSPSVAVGFFFSLRFRTICRII